MSDPHVQLLILYVVVAVGVSFLCSVAESVLLSLTPGYIALQKDKRPKAFKLLNQLKSNIEKPLAAILTLNTIAHTVGATGVGAEAVAIWGDSVVGITSAVMTIAILVLSEIIPKTLGANYWQTLSIPTAYFCIYLTKGLWPLVWFSEKITSFLSKGEKAPISRAEISALADLSHQEGGLLEAESKILKNLFKFADLQVKDIMTPRTVVICFPENHTVTEAIEEHPNLPVSRIPIYESSIDEVTGFVLRDDMYKLDNEEAKSTSLKSLKRDLLTVPNMLSLPKLFEKLLAEKRQVALVVDEYGGTSGIVSLEDLIETLIGDEIVDEADHQVDLRKYAIKKSKERQKKLGIKHGDSQS